MDQITENELHRQQRVINNLAKRLSDSENSNYKQSQAISKLSEYVGRVNTNSRVPFNEDVEEEIKKILE